MKKKEHHIPSEQEDFIASSKAAVLNKTTLLANSILYVIATLIIVGLIWSYFATIDQITVGNGKVIPTSKVKIIQSLDGGIIKTISVSEGEIVHPDQVLVKLDDTRYTADYLNGYQKYLALTASVARLTAEMKGQDQIDFPKDLENYADLRSSETKLFQTRREGGQKEMTILRHALSLAVKEVEMYNKLVKSGTVSMLELHRAQRSEDDIKEKILQKQASFRESVLTELTQRQGELSSLTDQLSGFRDKIEHTTIRSPIYGIIKKLNITTIGGVISPSMNIMEIVPLSDTLLVEARIDPKDIAFIHIGQAATVRITAYDYSIYGSLPGKVEYIGSDTLDEQKPTSSLSESSSGYDKNLPTYYIVRIRTERNYLGTEAHPLPILPGMVVNVHIMTGKKRVIDYLLKPLLKAKTEALIER